MGAKSVKVIKISLEGSLRASLPYSCNSCPLKAEQDSPFQESVIKLTMQLYIVIKALLRSRIHIFSCVYLPHNPILPPFRRSGEHVPGFRAWTPPPVGALSTWQSR